RDLGFPANLGGMLIIESDRGELATADIARVAEICSKAGAIEIAQASNRAESNLLHEARRLALPAMEGLGALLIDDIAVPRTKLVALQEGLETISTRRKLRIATVGHVGDGNMHPVVIFDRGTEDVRARLAFEDIMDLGLGLGGTVTGEHGVGLLKRGALGRALGDLLSALQRQIKTVFDPLAIMNPGKVFS
ncbi:MAG TPA: FAD-linked oxidase C-terminal domain-containing protein, partial [Nocardioides sp.]